MIWDKQRVLRLRQNLGLTQGELAETLGCRQQTVSEWELGLYAPANAYGKLLSNLEYQMNLSEPVVLKSQGHKPHQKEQFPDPKEIKPRKRHKPVQTQNFDEDELPFDKPFDPAID